MQNLEIPDAELEIPDADAEFGNTRCRIWKYEIKNLIFGSNRYRTIHWFRGMNLLDVDLDIGKY